MGHHHHYFTTPHPSNSTDINNSFSYHYISLIFFLFGVCLVYSYIRYVRTTENYRRNLENHQDDEDEFPDINNFFPDYLVRNHRNVNRELPPPPPAYEERRNLQEIEPPSYESIIPNNNTEIITGEDSLLENHPDSQNNIIV